jgi:hypothetical protein
MLLNVMMPLHRRSRTLVEIVALAPRPVEGHHGDLALSTLAEGELAMRIAPQLTLMLSAVLCFGCNMMDKSGDKSADADSKPAPQQKQPAQPKAVQLFNGKDLNNWTFFSKDANVKKEDVFMVKDGVIHCVGKPAGYIKTNDSYTSYNLKLQWRFVKPGNSGVLLRVQEPDNVWPQAVESQLNSGDAGDIWIINDYPAKLDPNRTKGRRTVKMKPSNEKAHRRVEPVPHHRQRPRDHPVGQRRDSKRGQGRESPTGPNRPPKRRLDHRVPQHRTDPSPVAHG